MKKGGNTTYPMQLHKETDKQVKPSLDKQSLVLG